MFASWYHGQRATQVSHFWMRFRCCCFKWFSNDHPETELKIITSQWLEEAAWPSG